jgi:ELWxxDGT repeat protein
VSGQLYFLWGYRLFRTDGTAAGTVRVGTGTYARIEPTDDGSLLLFGDPPGIVTRLAPGATTPATLLDNVIGRSETARVGKWIFFVGSRLGSAGIFRTDGTPQGTTQVAVAPRAENLTAAGGVVYFINDSDGAGREIWVTDGTPAGTRRVTDVVPGEGSGQPGNLIDAGALYFTAEDGVHGRELWRVIDDVAPTALASSFNYAGKVQTLTVTFSEDLANSLALSDWTLIDRATGNDVSTLLTSLSIDPETNVATLTLPPNLPKGDYRLTLPAGAATDRGGNPTLNDVALDFFHLPGDVNRDRAVNFSDLLILAKNYNTSSATYAQGDLTGDGVVNFADLVLLAKNYNASLPAPPAPPLSAPVIVYASTPLTATAAPRPKPPSVFRVTPAPPKPTPTPPKRPVPARKPR